MPDTEGSTNETQEEITEIPREETRETGEEVIGVPDKTRQTGEEILDTP